MSDESPSDKTATAIPPSPDPLRSGSESVSHVPPHAAPGKELTPAARRALEEAAVRRAFVDSKVKALQAHTEVQGRGGLEPVRYDDWEVKGIATDF